MRSGIFRALIVLALLCLAGTVVAQESSIIADGLTNPRAIAYDENGALFITEAGLGGDVDAQGPFGPVLTGSTSRVLALAADGGDPAVILDGFNSTQSFSDYVGVQSVLVDSATVWLALGDGPASFPFNRAMVGLDRTSLRVHTFVDLYTFEADQNPDGEDITSNPSDLAADGEGAVYIIDTSGNSLLKWTMQDGLQLFAAWQDLPVPTSVALDAEGNVYVGFLSAFPFDARSARIEKWSPAGELLETFEGLTAVTDVKVSDEGTIYAVQLADSFGDNGWNPNSGSIVTVTAEGLTPVAEGLSFPYAMAFAPDGSLSVTVNSSFSPAGSGQVISIPAG
jgi:hypothetical protein